ncbi:DUF441 domain-containing protein [Candidatus Formimonas warabiya]|uniref:UPF0756 membrane protein DCMF_19035 n=1 Tax=Formimonas warabiya TaxID=1761012 RepID=A0A3G1KVZ7_FORW1|nr:DUF441 domain-containing protein [Candidatus Formimonas warabiya]ATW26567.1 hypothetical protein DCMF_19035 [Candidatus Formimonas warabiya]
MSSTVILLGILAVAILGKANSVAIATCVLLLLKLIGLDSYVYPFIEKSGMTWGLIFLLAAIMIPIANGSISAENIKSVFTSWTGITALALSFFTTYLSGQGLNYLTVQGHGNVMPAMIIGAVGAAAFLGGVPVGPLITAGILALFAKIIHS